LPLLGWQAYVTTLSFFRNEIGVLKTFLPRLCCPGTADLPVLASHISWDDRCISLCNYLLRWDFLAWVGLEPWSARFQPPMKLGLQDEPPVPGSCLTF
jgi:hypothetical protein